MKPGLQTPSKELTQQVINEALEAHRKGDQHAGIRAFSAGVLAGRRNISASDCPFDNAEMITQWQEGIKLAQKAAKERRDNNTKDLDLFKQAGDTCKSHYQTANSSRS